MSYQVFGDIFETADLASTLNVYLRFSPDQDCVLRAMRSTFIFYNDPTFTNLTMKIYSNSGGSPMKLLASSTTTHTKASLLSDLNGITETYFEFDYVNLKGGDTYHFVARAAGYTGSDSSHIAWQKSWPDPIYAEGLSLTYERLQVASYQLALVSADV